MRKITVILVCLLLALLLTGCAAPQGADSSPTPNVVEAPKIEGDGPLARQAKKIMAPYEAQLERTALKCQGNLTYTIPGDMLNAFTQDALETGAQPENGRYQFVWRQSGQHTYQATGLEVQQQVDSAAAQATPDPMGDAPMDGQQMGDFSVSGGGYFERSRAYDVAADLSGGTMEMTDTLDGNTTGHEFFAFSCREDALYFVDAALDFSAGLDGLENSGAYLVAAGVIKENALEIVEYRAANRESIPTPETLDMQALLRQITPVTHLTVGEK